MEYKGWLAGLLTPSQKVKLKPGTIPFGRMYYEYDIIGPYNIAASIRKYGKGKIAGTYFNYGERYCNGKTSVARDFFNGLVRELFNKPLVDVKGFHNVDVCVNRINGKLAINLVNTSGPHNNKDVYVYDEIPPIGPLKIIIRGLSGVSKIIVEPGGNGLDYQIVDGEIHTVLPRLEIHQIIVVEE